MALTLKKVPYVMLSVENMDKTLAFYTERLGLKLGYADQDWAELQTESFVLALHRMPAEAVAGQRTGSPVVIFASEDIVADRQALLAMDIAAGELHQVAESPQGVGISCDFSDPEGQPLSLFAQLSHSQWEAIRNA